MIHCPLNNGVWTPLIEHVELVLEKTEFPPSQTYQRARFEAGIPSLGLTSNNIHAEYQLLKERGAKFRGEPQDLPAPLPSDAVDLPLDVNEADAMEQYREVELDEDDYR